MNSYNLPDPSTLGILLFFVSSCVNFSHLSPTLGSMAAPDASSGARSPFIPHVPAEPSEALGASHGIGHGQGQAAELAAIRGQLGTQLQGSRGQAAGLQCGRGSHGVRGRGPSGGRGRGPAAARGILFCTNFVHEYVSTSIKTIKEIN